jgi:hypothetical protein
MVNSVEREAIILNAAWEMIDDLVNWGVFVRTEKARPSNLMFETRSAARLFVILLGDFLSDVRAFKGDPVPLGLLPAPSGARLSDLTFLFHLRQVAASPHLASETHRLSVAMEAFGAWLDGEFTASGVNLHSINVVADLKVSRFRYLKMCGDIAKHNLARLATNAGHLRKLLAAAGHEISEQESYLAIEPFFEWFFDDIFIYHSSVIAEFLNNIRWEIYDCLRTEFRRSWHLTELATPDFAHYSYRVPAEITDPLARAMYWDLMNRCRSAPYVQRFEISPSFRERY